jgi:hypothetical protein
VPLGGRVKTRPQAERNAIASQVLDSLADEEAWRQRFEAKRDVLQRMAREARDEDERGETLPLREVL